MKAQFEWAIKGEINFVTSKLTKKARGGGGHSCVGNDGYVRLTGISFSAFHGQEGCTKMRTTGQEGCEGCH